MSLPQPPKDPAQQLQWLLDRAAISDLMIEYARSVDERDWEAFGAIWAEEATFALPVAEAHGRDAIVAAVSDPEQGVSAWDSTHHLNTNHQIHIDGDTATARACLFASHIRLAHVPNEHSDAGGWYDCTFRRTPDGWRYTSSSLTISWETGTDLPGGAPRSDRGTFASGRAFVDEIRPSRPTRASWSRCGGTTSTGRPDSSACRATPARTLPRVSRALRMPLGREWPAVRDVRACRALAGVTRPSASRRRVAPVAKSSVGSPQLRRAIRAPGFSSRPSRGPRPCCPYLLRRLQAVAIEDWAADCSAPAPSPRRQRRCWRRDGVDIT